MTAQGEGSVVTCGSMEARAYPESHLVVLRFVAETSLTGAHGAALVEALRGVVGTDGDRFALLGVQTFKEVHENIGGVFILPWTLPVRIAWTVLPRLLLFAVRPCNLTVCRCASPS